MAEFSYHISADGTLQAFHNGGFYSCGPEHKRYQDILEAIRSGQIDDLPNMINTARALEEYVSQSGHLRVTGGHVLYRNVELHFSFVERLLDMLEQKLPVTPFVNFIERLMKNPSRACIEELYGFMTRGNARCHLPLYHDGRFRAYKRVNQDYLDFHSRSKHYFPLQVMYKDDPRVNDMNWLLQQKGYIVKQPRWNVDDNIRKDCSIGLHFGRFEYLQSFHAGDPDSHMLAAAIDPMHVVAANRDSAGHKIRVHYAECREEITKEFVGLVMGEISPTPKMTENFDDYAWDDEEELEEMNDEDIDDDDDDDDDSNN